MPFQQMVEKNYIKYNYDSLSHLVYKAIKRYRTQQDKFFINFFFFFFKFCLPLGIRFALGLRLTGSKGKGDSIQRCLPSADNIILLHKTLTDHVDKIFHNIHIINGAPSPTFFAIFCYCEFLLLLFLLLCH